MYEPNKKYQFLVDMNIDKTERKNYISAFNITGDYEKKSSCELANLRKSDFLELFKISEWILNHNTFSNRKSMIKKYLKWCYQGDKDKLSTFSCIHYKDINKNFQFDYNYFRNFKELHKYTSLFLDYAEADKVSTYEITVCMIYLLWLQLKYEDIMELCVNDFNYESKTITYGKDRLVISNLNETMLELFEKVKIRASKQGYSKLIYSDERNKEYTSTKFIDLRLKRFNELGDEKKFTYLKIQKSGLYSRIYNNQKKYNCGDTIIEFDYIVSLLNLHGIQDRERDSYNEWKRWCEDDSNSVLKTEIDNIEEDFIAIKEKMLQDDYWSLIKSRIGQSYFRDVLIRNNNCRCAVCKISLKDILIASHIKEFANCSGTERYDSMNGLLLCANHDKLFDQHLITFDEKGNIIVSKKLNSTKIKNLNIDLKLNIKAQIRYNEAYMVHHRNIFNKINIETNENEKN